MRKKVQGIILIIVALGLIGFATYNLLEKPEKKDDRFTTKKESIEKEKTLKKDEIGSEYKTGEDLKEGYYINKEFTLEYLSEDMKIGMEGKEDDLIVEVQKKLYENGFAGIQNAKVIGKELPDYVEEIILTISTGVDNDIIMNAIYNRSAQIWQLIMW